MAAEQTVPAPTSSRVDARWLAVANPYGVASLRHTHWLDDEFRAYDTAPGEWAAVDGAVVGRGVPTDAAAAVEVTLRPGEQVQVGALLLRAIDRDGSPALRVFDPENPARARLRGIDSFAADPAWVRSGAFEPAEQGSTRRVESVDGYESEEAAVGTVVVDLPDGERARLTVSSAGDAYWAVIADGTSNVDAYRFRFLPIDAASDDGSVTVDFNRAYLPPCAFSDQYVCPLPPANNRLSVRVEAGERVAVTGG